MAASRIAVVGIGTMGSQVLWQLAKRGYDVTGYELFAPGHSRGAAGGETRLFRTIQMEDHGYAPIADRADELYRALEADSGQQLRDITGALVMGHPSSPDTQTALEAAERSAHPVRVLDREESMREFPEFALDPGDVTIWDGHGGIIRPELTVATAAAQAQRHGVTILRRHRVTAIEDTGSGVHVTADGQTRQFDRVVAAPGAWTSLLFPELAGLFEMRRLLSAWFFPAVPGQLERVLPFLRTKPAQTEKNTYAYGLPYADRTAMKLGLGSDQEARVDSPDTADYYVTDTLLEPFAEWIGRYMPVLDPYPMRIATYFESFTASGREYVQAHPQMENVIVMAGFSGHGFKMAPAFGEIGADLAEGRTPALDIGFLQRDEVPLTAA
ncbi:FAD-dependent oxidoreductase [Sediminivirga luteola]|nr:FAD-dependent oxidoreductase [Sediminivirga luteola]